MFLNTSNNYYKYRCISVAYNQYAVVLHRIRINVPLFSPSKSNYPQQYSYNCDFIVKNCNARSNSELPQCHSISPGSHQRLIMVIIPVVRRLKSPLCSYIVFQGEWGVCVVTFNPVVALFAVVGLSVNRSSGISVL